VGQTLRYFWDILVATVHSTDVQIDIGEEAILFEYLQETEDRGVQITK
jgi:hypothetical protein